MFISGFGVGFYYSWKLTLVILAVAPLLGIGGAFLMKVMGDLTSEGLGSYATAGGIAEEAFGMIRTVASLGAEPRLEKKYQAELVTAEKSGIRKAKLTGIGLGFTMGVYFACYALAFWYGSVLVIADRESAAEDYPYDPLLTINGTVCTVGGLSPDVCGSVIFNDFTDVCACAYCNCGCFDSGADCLEGGSVMLVFFAVVMGSFALGQASPSISAITNGRAAAGVVFEVIDTKPKVDAEGDTGLKPSTCTGYVSFQNVQFSYPSRPDAVIFPDLSLEVESGTTVALVGGSGSGKSTVISLIERFYDPLNGSILLDGNNIKDLNVSWLRSQIGLVGQEPTLFATTIAQNIAYGLGPDRKATREQVEKAAKMSNAHDFIMGFPGGYGE
jgi:ATP-binding cassette subfamily B (MDR/TAP) protein 1